jgi:Lamin Tail Domain/Secretion system C-terminal sorting domain
MKKFFTTTCVLFLVLVSFNNLRAAAQVVIWEIYGGGNNAGAVYQNDFILLKNIGDAPQSLTGWSVQYASAAGTSWNTQIQALSGTIAMGGYCLISLAGGTTNGVALPSMVYGTTPISVTGTINMSATNGKVALCNSTTALTGSPGTLPAALGNPGGASAAIVDFVGFGTANQYEGASAAPPGSNTTSIRRNSGDTNVNGSDFSVASSPLPILLINFEAKKNILSFSTATETKSSHFEIERSQDGKLFANVGRVEAAGNSIATKKYEFEDKTAMKGVNYYRLKQVDWDGRFEYSKVVSTYLGDKSLDATVISSQANQLSLSIQSNSNEDATLQIVDMNGRLVVIYPTFLTKDNNVIMFDTNLQNGTYALKIVTNSGAQVSKLLSIK